MSAPRSLISLCTYNERENLAQIVPEIRAVAPEADILVVDDGSPDGTGRLADEFAANDPHVRVLHRQGKLGLGSAIVAAFRYAIEHGYDYVINLDADFSHPPRYIPDLLAAMDRADVAIGSRYVPGGRIEGWGPKRHFMSRGVNLYARLLLGLPTRDNSGSFRCYRVSLLERLDFDRVRAHGYAFMEEILSRLKRVGCRFVEVPITFEERRHGSSKIDWREAAHALWVIFRLGVENVTRR
ncbi:MAG: polyprenol monophosphomannose synthase [Planctomycetales bacterium]